MSFIIKWKYKDEDTEEMRECFNIRPETSMSQLFEWLIFYCPLEFTDLSIKRRDEEAS